MKRENQLGLKRSGWDRVRRSNKERMRETNDNDNNHAPAGGESVASTLFRLHSHQQQMSSRRTGHHHIRHCPTMVREKKDRRVYIHTYIIIIIGMDERHT